MRLMSEGGKKGKGAWTLNLKHKPLAR
jgi:hypothetical protein